MPISQLQLYIYSNKDWLKTVCTMIVLAQGKSILLHTNKLAIWLGYCSWLERNCQFQ